MKTEQKEVVLKSLLDIQKQFPNEESCRDFLMKQRWNGGSVCIRCGSTRELYRINGGKLLKCPDCRKQFSIRVGTIFEDSALPLQKWFMAIYLLSAHKKGISSCQLARDLGITQKSAWHMLHRIRYGIKSKSYKAPLKGTVEVDETYVGGKNKGGKGGRGSENKTMHLKNLERETVFVYSLYRTSKDIIITEFRCEVDAKGKIFFNMGELDEKGNVLNSHPDPHSRSVFEFKQQVEKAITKIQKVSPTR